MIILTGLFFRILMIIYLGLNAKIIQIMTFNVGTVQILIRASLCDKQYALMLTVCVVVFAK